MAIQATAAAPGVARGASTTLRIASSVLSGVDACLWSLSDDGVADLLTSVARLRAVLERVEVAAVREGLTRGLHTAGGYGATDWVRRCQQRAGGAAVTDPAHVARVLRVGACADRPSGRAVWQAFVSGDLGLGKADQVARFEREVSPVAAAESVESAVDQLVAAATDSVEDGTGLTPRELATAVRVAGRLVKPERDLEAEHDARARGRSFTRRPGPAGLCEYRVLLDPDGAAVVDAAVAGLSAPMTSPDGTPDPRTATRRRADALVEIVRRGVSSPGAAPKTSKAQVIVTMTLAELLAQMRTAPEGATTGCQAPPSRAGAGVTATGEVLSPTEVRRHACDAGIIPMVLGSRGEVLDVGVESRLFTPGQRRALWRRDGGCTFPGCTIPAQWCDAHHVRHWVHGGRTDLSNAALLCGRHHTTVHRHDLTATVTQTGVVWDLAPGSGTRALLEPGVVGSRAADAESDHAASSGHDRAAGGGHDGAPDRASTRGASPKTRTVMGDRRAGSATTSGSLTTNDSGPP
ncbi:HNH endonuclease signature motif containing protein [Luteipulveratus halotolerans]|uniref:HNH endonuclease signature motif containing protein n=1 Tax=Luteipulveratus halotolerans TaxID=1631356 RepID=UPI0006813E87|nr:HNH endonuclease signature motif containing protein [Luteipulveratus halotolerans]